MAIPMRGRTRSPLNGAADVAARGANASSCSSGSGVAPSVLAADLAQQSYQEAAKGCPPSSSGPHGLVER